LNVSVLVLGKGANLVPISAGFVHQRTQAPHGKKDLETAFFTPDRASYRPGGDLRLQAIEIMN